MSKSATAALAGELEKMNKGGESYKDERFWKPEQGKDGNGYAVIRFLPAPEGEDVPWVRVFSHGFQGKGGWFIENCPTTIGKKCPLCEANNELWNSGLESDKDIARQRKRKLNYIANILVVEDSANPSNNGKVFLYKFGKKIFDKITEKMQPEFKDEQPINPFDFWQGCNFKLKIRQVEGYTNYDKSEFEASSALYSGDDDKLEALWKKQHSLQAFVAPDQFKSYEELKERLFTVLSPSAASNSKAEDTEVKQTLSEKFEKKTSSRPSAPAPAPTKPSKAPMNEGEDENDALAYFRKLAEED
jgi:hypothetical protein